MPPASGASTTSAIKVPLRLMGTSHDCHQAYLLHSGCQWVVANSWPCFCMNVVSATCKWYYNKWQAVCKSWVGGLCQCRGWVAANSWLCLHFMKKKLVLVRQDDHREIQKCQVKVDCPGLTSDHTGITVVSDTCKETLWQVLYKCVMRVGGCLPPCWRTADRA